MCFSLILVNVSSYNILVLQKYSYPQLQGNKATEITNLISLKEKEASTKSSKVGMTKPSLMHYLFLRDHLVPVIIPHLTLLLDQTLFNGLN